jgi:hypothetical protein
LRPGPVSAYLRWGTWQGEGEGRTTAEDNGRVAAAQCGARCRTAKSIAEERRAGKKPCGIKGGLSQGHI